MSFFLGNLAARITTIRPLFQQRWIASSTIPLRMPLDEFRDTVSREERMKEKVGRAWTVKELRRKSFDDIHKLWYVLYKERNMLTTEANLARRKGLVFPQSHRRHKVKKSMGAIKHVLGERKIDKLASVALKNASLADKEKGITEHSDVEP